MAASSQRSAAARNGLFSLLLFVLLVIGGWLLLWPAYQDVEKAQAELAAAQKSRDEKSKTLRDVKTLLTEYAAHKQKIAVLEQALPPAPAVPQLLADVEIIARQSAMKIESLKVTEPAAAEARRASPAAASPTEQRLFKSPELARLKIELKVSGGFNRVPLLLELLQRNARLFDIQTVTVDTGEGSKDSGTGKFGLTMTAYYQKLN